MNFNQPTMWYGDPQHQMACGIVPHDPPLPDEVDILCNGRPAELLRPIEGAALLEIIDERGAPQARTSPPSPDTAVIDENEPPGLMHRSTKFQVLS